MLDIRFIRENTDLIRANLRLRRDEEKIKDFERLLELDERVRALMRDIQDQRTQRNKLSREIGELKKSGKDSSKLEKQVGQVNDKIRSLESEKESVSQKERGYR